MKMKLLSVTSIMLSLCVAAASAAPAQPDDGQAPPKLDVPDHFSVEKKTVKPDNSVDVLAWSVYVGCYVLHFDPKGNYTSHTPSNSCSN